MNLKLKHEFKIFAIQYLRRNIHCLDLKRTNAIELFLTEV